MKTCIVIHTLVSFIEEGDEDNEFMDQLVREGTDIPGEVIGLGQADEERSDTAREARGQTKRTEFKTMLFESLYTI